MASNDELALANDLALQQISRLERGENPDPVKPLATSEKTNFWGADDYASKYRPSTTAAGIPLASPTLARSYYTSPGVGSIYGGPQGLYQKLAVAMYRATKSDPQGTAPQPQKFIEVGTDLNIEEESDAMNCLGGDFFTKQAAEATPVLGEPIFKSNLKLRKPNVSQDTSNQMSAIVLSGAAKIITSLVINWAKDRRVPIEIL